MKSWLSSKQEGSMPTIPGKAFYRALAYAREAVPSADAAPRLSHMAFIQDKIIGSDGSMWFVGLLPEEAALEEPIVVARESIDELLLGLDYAHRVSKRHSAPFDVELHPERVVIKYGARDKDRIEHDLILCKLGELPKEWAPPVPVSAPELLASQIAVSCGKMIQAMKWYRSWERDKGAFTFHGAGGHAPFRVDITCDGDKVAQAYLLPEGTPAAQLPPDEPLFEGRSGPARSQSLLDLQLIDEPAEGSKKKKRKKDPEGEAADDLQ